MSIADFEKGECSTQRWSTINDSVMGGVSTCALRFSSSQKAAQFHGQVSTANNGGFASVRSEARSWIPVVGAQGIRLVCKGDGRVYKFTVKMDDAYDSVTYQHDFQSPGEWCQVDLPFRSFQASWRARIVPNAPPVVGEKIRQLGIMVSKFTPSGGVVPGFKPGEFNLLIKSVNAIA